MTIQWVVAKMREGQVAEYEEVLSGLRYYGFMQFKEHVTRLLDLEESEPPTCLEDIINIGLEGHGILDRLQALEDQIKITGAAATVEVINIEKYGRREETEARQYLLRIDGLLYHAVPHRWVSPGPGGAIRSGNRRPNDFLGKEEQ
jgi:hypothetical protein